MRSIQNLPEINPVKQAIQLVGLFIAVALLAAPAQSYAQADVNPTQATTGGEGEVSGIIVNQSPGGKISGVMDIMLHAWDANNAEKVMLHGKSNADGSFAFTDITLQPGLAYAVMADYQGATYYSDPIPVKAEKDLSDIKVPVYDLTQDLSAVRIEEMHILFNWINGDLGITEVYIFSNTGEYTVKDGLSLEDGTPVTLKLPLPEEAWDVSFGRSSADRFKVYKGGFADTAALLPGQPTSQIIVSYMLPYEDSITYDFAAPFDIASIDFFYPQDAGMTVMNDLLEPKGDWDNPNGGKFLIYSYPPMKSGEGVELKVLGAPPLEPVVPDSAVQSEVESVVAPKASGAFPSNLVLGIGILGGFGLILIGAGVWIWRRSVAEDELEEELEDEPQDSGLAGFLAGVIDLEQAYGDNEIEQEQYLRERAALNQQIRAEIERWETQHSGIENSSEGLSPSIDPEISSEELSTSIDPDQVD